MPNARHPRQYPRGPRHPKLPISPAWKKRVLAELVANRLANREPRNEAELARMIGADKGGLHDALHGTQASYKYARRISEILGIGDAMVANPELSVSADEWEQAVRLMRAASPEQQRKALAILRTLLLDDE